MRLVQTPTPSFRSAGNATVSMRPVIGTYGADLIAAHDAAVAAAAAAATAETNAETAETNAETAQAAAEVAQAAAEAVGSTNDGIMTGVDANAASAFRVQQDARHTATFATLPGMGFAPARYQSQEALGSDPMPFDALDGYLYGWTGNNLYRAIDPQGPWTLVKDFSVSGPTGGSTAGDFTGLKDLGNGEVMVARLYGLFVSSGWTANPATATWTRKVEATSGSWFAPYCTDSDPSRGWVVATSYASPAYSSSRYVWVSEDNGATFTQKYDLNTVHPGEAATSHMHLAALDPYVTGPTPRIWISGHDTAGTPAFALVAYSDDGGGTWTVLDSDNHPVCGCATPIGMVFGSDDNTNGVARVVRTTVPADMVYDWALKLPRAPVGIQGMRAYRDEATGYAHIAFLSYQPNDPGLVISTDGYRADITYEILPDATTDTPNIKNVMVVGDQLVGVYIHSGGVNSVLYGEVPQRGTRPIADSGGVLGGTVGKSPGLAVGRRSATTNPNSTAVGDNASAVSDSTAVGQGAAANASGVAIGHAASASSTNGIAVGKSATASGASGTVVGMNASASGASSTVFGYAATTGAHNSALAVGANSAVTGLGGTALGGGATTATGVAVGLLASATTGVAVGNGAKSQNSRVTSVGTNAGSTSPSGATDATTIGFNTYAGTNGTAIGSGAQAGTNGVALGAGTVTTLNDQVSIGARHMQGLEIAATPAIPPLEGWQIYGKDNGSGKTQVCVQFRSGGEIVIATQP